MAAAMENGIRLSKTSPSFLHANSTSHTWTFSAIAELIDNAYDPDVSARMFFIDTEQKKGITCLTFVDNGSGLSPDKLHKMLSFGYCEKVEIKGHKPVGHYGNGFKSGSMRLGQDALVFTKHGDTKSVGFLSQTYLKAINAETVLVPICTWHKKANIRVVAPDADQSLEAITKYSLFNSEKELLQQFEFGVTGPDENGTKIIIYNLKKGKDGHLELDFESKADDIINPETMELDEVSCYRAVREYYPEYRKSLREYCSILYLKPRMKIYLRGKKVKTMLIAKSLKEREIDVYKPIWLHGGKVQIWFGFNKNEQEYGLMMYNKNRLIKAFEKVGCQRQMTNEKGIGVVGVVEMDFLEPIHNKQDFAKDEKYNSCTVALGKKLDEYWNEKREKLKEGYVNPEHTRRHLPDWTWVQCDNANCLKWRRLPDEVANQDLPDKWYCYMNPDATHNRCAIDEEPEDEDDVAKATYEKTYNKILLQKRATVKEDERRRLEDTVRELQVKRHELDQLRQNIPKMRPIAARVTSSADGKQPDRELLQAKQELEAARRREQEQVRLIQQLAHQKKQVELKQRLLETQAQQLKTIAARSEALVQATAQGNAVSSSSGHKRSAHSSSHGGKKQRIAEVSDDFIITRNDSDDDIISLGSSDEDEDENESAKRRQSGGLKVQFGKRKNQPPTANVKLEPEDISDNEVGDVKPNVNELNAQIAQESGTSPTKNAGVVTTMNKPTENASENTVGHNSNAGDDPSENVGPNTEAADSYAQGDNSNVAMSDSDVNKANKNATVPTTTLKQKNLKSTMSQTDQDLSQQISKLEGVVQEKTEEVENVKQKLKLLQNIRKDGDKQLQSLRDNVRKLLAIIVPDVEIHDIENVDEIVVQMIKVNSENEENLEETDQVSSQGVVTLESDEESS